MLNKIFQCASDFESGISYHIVEAPERDQEDAAAISGGGPPALLGRKINDTPPEAPEDSTVVLLKVKKAS